MTDFFTRHGALIGKPTKRSGPQPFLLFEKDEFLVNFTRSLDNLLVGDKPVHPGLQRVKLEELLLYLAVHYPAQMQRIRDMNYRGRQGLLNCHRLIWLLITG
ncbi:hypothetical protein [Niastella koreensis]|uniref:hypothetical protein n=1 Tax=Niastella koreensis TaxID=354356 RepID=UPI003CC7DA0C